jgi:hypothetical protein
MSADGQGYVVAWRNLVANGTEYCCLSQTPEGWLLEGTAVTAPKQVGPLLAHYRVHCDSQWRSHRVFVERTTAGDRRTIELQLEGRGGWRESTRLRPDLRACIDVDLGITPSTNLLPIRRLSLAIGQSAEIDAAWIKFPELTVQPLRQRYTRLAENRYRYESGTGFKAEITVDAAGLPTLYEGVWERIAVGGSAPPSPEPPR